MAPRKDPGIARAARVALETPERVRRVLVPVSWWVGVAGMAALAGTAVLALTPADRWPDALDPDRLPFYVVVALATASLLGWGCMQQGQTRIRRAVGKPGAIVLFLVLPVLAAGISYLATRDVEPNPEEWPGGPWIVDVARWTTPAIVLASLASFVSWKARPRRRIFYGRGAWTLVLVAPYAALLAVVVFGVPAPEAGRPIEDSLHEVLGSLGEASIVLQLIVGYFLSAGTPK